MERKNKNSMGSGSLFLSIVLLLIHFIILNFSLVIGNFLLEKEHISSQYWNGSDAAGDVFFTEHYRFETHDSCLPISQRSTPFPIEENEQDIKESLNDIDDINKNNLLNTRKFDFILKSREVSFAHYELSVLNRTDISLVILHHTWRLFFS